MSTNDLIFKALADGNRRRMLSALRTLPRTAGELAGQAGLAPNAASFHLRWLIAAGLIRAERRGRFLWYHIREEPLRAWWRELEGNLVPTAETPRKEPPAARKRAGRQAERKRLARRVATTEPLESPMLTTEDLPTELL